MFCFFFSSFLWYLLFLGGLNRVGKSAMARLTAWIVFNFHVPPAPVSSLAEGGLCDRPSSSGKWSLNLQPGLNQARSLFDSKTYCLDHVPPSCCSASPLLVVSTRRNFSNPLEFGTLSLQCPLLVPPLPVLFGCMSACSMPWAVERRDRMSMLESIEPGGL